MMHPFLIKTPGEDFLNENNVVGLSECKTSEI
jgi:hypothetical protein